MQDLDQRIAAATAGIGQQFILLPIHGQPAAFRERVYCYELYHQLRKDWPWDSPFELNGEVDKAGHLHLRQWNADNCKPDFLIHTPGDMQGNFAVLEVKPCQASARAIRKDLSTLALFSTDDIGYKRAIYLIYGERPAQQLDAKSNEVKELKRVLKETRQAKEIGDKQVQDLASINATLEERLKEQTKTLAESAGAAQVSTLVAERDALAVENQELKVWVAELQAELQGRLVGRIGQSRPVAKP